MNTLFAKPKDARRGVFCANEEKNAEPRTDKCRTDEDSAERILGRNEAEWAGNQKSYRASSYRDRDCEYGNYHRADSYEHREYYRSKCDK
jgi:hypothetical protein